MFKHVICAFNRFANKLENFPCKGKHLQFIVYKLTFSIKAHFLIWSYQAYNMSYKLVTCMATNLVLEKIKLHNIKLSFHFSLPLKVHFTGLLIYIASFIEQHFQSWYIF